MRIQAVIDDKLYKAIQSNAKKTGLSVSAITRLALINFVKPKSKMSIVEQSLVELQNDETETLTLTQFNKEIDDLMT